MSTTPNIGLTLPNYDAPNWNNALNANFTLIDTAVGALEDSASPPNPYSGEWTKYILQVASPNWQVNGTSAGAMSSSSSVQQIPLFTTAARTVFHAILLKHSVAFAGGALASIVVSLGTAAVPDSLMAVAGDTFDVLQTVSDLHFYVAGGAKMLSAAATPVILQMSCQGGDPSALTAGTLEIEVFCSSLP